MKRMIIQKVTIGRDKEATDPTSYFGYRDITEMEVKVGRKTKYIQIARSSEDFEGTVTSVSVYDKLYNCEEYHDETEEYIGGEQMTDEMHRFMQSEYFRGYCYLAGLLLNVDDETKEYTEDYGKDINTSWR